MELRDATNRRDGERGEPQSHRTPPRRHANPRLQEIRNTSKTRRLIHLPVYGVPSMDEEQQKVIEDELKKVEEAHYKELFKCLDERWREWKGGGAVRGAGEENGKWRNSG